ncbi:MAG: hypothetical protein A3G24_23490 [Betaproteobacteria bacterium RIFCSPLOWO2_12_FULL_62_13]|nr:MAG: hypothetical protein A3G24_23490 [Betaproteobacteria bacterium RIFCSPLOWO2_12_FULL_62_13]
MSRKLSFNQAKEDEIDHDNRLFADACLGGVLTTAERYHHEGAPADLAASEFQRLAVKHQRIRPYWFTLMHPRYAGSGDIEVRADGSLELARADGSARDFLEKVLSEINGQPSLSGVDRGSKDFDYALRLELKRREFFMVGESSYYRGRSAP